jgi:hypothetical protein
VAQRRTASGRMIRAHEKAKLSRHEFECGSEWGFSVRLVWIDEKRSREMVEEGATISYSLHRNHQDTIEHIMHWGV